MNRFWLRLIDLGITWQNALRLLKWSFGFAVIYIIGWIINFFWFKPSNITDFYERVLLEYADIHPEFASETRIYENYGLYFQHTQLSIQSDTLSKMEFAWAERNITMLDNFKLDQQPDNQRLSMSVLSFHLINFIKFHQTALLIAPIGIDFGPHVDFPAFMLRYHPITHIKQAHSYVQRLGEFSKSINELKQTLYRMEADTTLQELGQEPGIPPIHVLRLISQQLGQLTAEPYQKSILYTNFIEQLAKVRGVTQEVKEELLADLAQELQHSVYSSYNSLKNYIDELIGRLEQKMVENSLVENVGAWRIDPSNFLYYNLLQKYTTSNLDLEELFANFARRARAEEDSLVERLTLLMDSLAIPADSSLGKRVRNYLYQPAFLFAEGVKGQEEIRAYFNAFVQENKDFYTQKYGGTPLLTPTLTFFGEFEGKYAEKVDFLPPSIDFAIPARVLINPYTPFQLSKPCLRSQLFGLTFPGNTLQHSLAYENEELPNLRKVFHIAFHEDGWAAFAEEIALKDKKLTKIEEQIGMLYNGLERAAKMRLDLAIHYEQLSMDAAIAELKLVLGYSQEQAQIAIDKIICNPGKACSYLIGRNKFRELLGVLRKGANYSSDKEMNYLFALLSEGHMSGIDMDHFTEDFLKAN